MNNGEARRILAQLAEGVDPITGEVLPEQHVCNEPAVIRALYKAVSALDASAQILPASQREKENGRCLRANRVNNTKVWTPEEDTYLRHAHRCGETYEQMSAQLQRSPHVIRCRSAYLGLTDSKGDPGRPAPMPGRERQGQPWYPEEDELLVQMFGEGCSVKDMTVRLKRSAGGITSRLEKHGLLENKHGDWANAAQDSPE